MLHVWLSLCVGERVMPKSPGIMCNNDALAHSNGKKDSEMKPTNTTCSCCYTSADTLSVPEGSQRHTQLAC